MKQHQKEHLGDKPLPAIMGGGDGRTQSNMAIVNEEAKILGVINKRLPLQFSNSHDSGKEREIRNSCWLRRGLIVEVTEGGKRQVSTEYIPLRPIHTRGLQNKMQHKFKYWVIVGQNKIWAWDKKCVWAQIWVQLRASLYPLINHY